MSFVFCKWFRDVALVRSVLGSFSGPASALLKLLLLFDMRRWLDKGWRETLGGESGNFKI